MARVSKLPRSRLTQPGQLRRPVAGMEHAPGARVNLPLIQLSLELARPGTGALVCPHEDRRDGITPSIDAEQAMPKGAESDRASHPPAVVDERIDGVQT